MKILELRDTRGPNFWSVKRHKLIVMLLDLQDLEDRPTNVIPGFYKRLKECIPTLYEHTCSEGKPGGFFQRVESGTWMGHVIEHIALEIQSLAGMSTGFGRTRSTSKRGVYHVVFSYEYAAAGLYAAEAAVRIAEAFINDQSYDLSQDLNALHALREKERFGPSTGSIVEEALKRNIPVLRLNNDCLVQLGYGSKQKRIEATIASTTSQLAVDIACNKEATKNLLSQAEIPVPEGIIIDTLDDLKKWITTFGYPLVIKPYDGNHGRGVTIDINNWNEAAEAFELAHSFSPKIICERKIVGKDYRALVINYKFVAAALRTPASVTGTGKHSIRELVDQENANPLRGHCHEKLLTTIKVDPCTINLLKKKGLTLESILPAGQQVYLKETANISTGGTATDVTELVNPQNILLFERIARVIGLDICGIDIVAPGLCTPIEEHGGAVIEVNAAPGFRMHLQPSSGKPRNVAKPVIDMLFPEGNDGRIPIIAITGTNGKTTTTRLIAHMVKKGRHNVGYTTTDGIYINDQLMIKGDCTGPRSAEFILRDPLVDIAVLECARGGLLRSGLGFSACDIAVITNVAEDHLGLEGIDTLEKLARVKSVLAETVKSTGYAILNADDDLVYKMQNDIDCNVALFSMNENSARIRRHTEKGGLAIVYENGYLTILDGNNKIRVEHVNNIPVTFSGAAEFNVTNALAATLAMYAQYGNIEQIREALHSFIPSADTTPGRLNIFHINDISFMVDYAHNPHGLKALGKFLKSVEATVRVGIIAGVGDRRSEDIIAVGEEAAQIFDEIIIRQDRDNRGRSSEEMLDLLSMGIKKVDPYKKIFHVPAETEAIDTALCQAKPGSLVVLLSDDITSAIKTVKSYKRKSEMSFTEEGVK